MVITQWVRKLTHQAFWMDSSSPSLKSWLRTLVTFIWSGGTVGILVLAVPLAALLAYQVPFHARVNLARHFCPLPMTGTYRPEVTAAGHLQRWTTPDATITLPGVGAGAMTLRLRLFGGAVSDSGRVLTMRANGQLLARLPLRPSWQEIQVLVPQAASAAGAGDLVLRLEVPPLEAPHDSRTLGVSLLHLDLIPHRMSGLRLPPLAQVERLLFVALLTFWSLRATGLSPRQALIGAGALLLLLAYMLAGYLESYVPVRLQVAAALPLLIRVFTLTLVLALGLLAVTQRWGWRRAPGWAVAVRCAVLLIFALRLVGVQHPQFAIIDQRLRAHQLTHIAQGRAWLVLPQLEQQHEWGTREPVPYSLLTYYLLLPLAWYWQGRALVVAIQLVVILLDALVPLLLYLLVRGGPRIGTAAGWAGLCYAALPIGYLFFHDGSFPTTMGVWIALAALVAVTWVPSCVPIDTGGGASSARHVVQRWLKPRQMLVWILVVTLLALAIVAYITHIAFMTFLVLMLAISLRWLGRTATLRRMAVPLLLALGLALVIDWWIYYRDYTLTLIRQTIPAFVSLIATEGSVGRDPERFFNTPILSVPMHLVAHFRVWPALLGGMALTLLLLHWRDRLITHLGLAYAALLATTALVERWFGLWNKHMYFVAPGVAMLAGLGLAWLWPRGRVSRIVCVTLWLYLFWESIFAWSNRVLWYILPPDAL